MIKYKDAADRRLRRAQLNWIKSIVRETMGNLVRLQVHTVDEIGIIGFYIYSKQKRIGYLDFDYLLAQIVVQAYKFEIYSPHLTGCAGEEQDERIFDMSDPDISTKIGEEIRRYL